MILSSLGLTEKSPPKYSGCVSMFGTEPIEGYINSFSCQSVLDYQMGRYKYKNTFSTSGTYYFTNKKELAEIHMQPEAYAL